MAAQMYSSIASSKAKRAATDAAVNAERQRLSDVASRGRRRGGEGEEGGPLVLQFPPSLKVWCRESQLWGKGPCSGSPLDRVWRPSTSCVICLSVD